MAALYTHAFLQVIVDVNACARYMAKYAAKGEPRSQPVSAIFKSCVYRLRTNSDSCTALRSAMMRSVGERDFSAQETGHMLLSLPLVSCTYTFVTVSLDASRRLREDRGVTGELLVASVLDHYAVCTDLLELNSYTFISQYTVHHSTIQKRATPVIVRTSTK